jgi:sortase A
LVERKQLLARARAATAALLFALTLTVAGCAGGEEGASAPTETPDEPPRTGEAAGGPDEERVEETSLEETGPEADGEASGAGEDDEYAEILERASSKATPDLDDLEGAPEMKEWTDPAGEDTPDTARFFNTGGSAGAIPAVKPFNFGRDPGGPEDKTMYVSVPKIGLDGVEVINSTSDEALTESTVHVPATGFPWQEGANTYIAGHRIGYEGTGSFQVFYDLDQLVEGDEIVVTDSEGNRFAYRVFNTLVTDPFDVEVMNPVDGKSVVTLQTCTLPDYAERLVVQGELVEGDTVPA